MNKQDLIYPVYTFVGYYERDYVFYASSRHRADEFIRAYNWVSRGNDKQGAYYGISRPAKGEKLNNYRGWELDFEYGYHTATHADYDADYQGPEDGWVSNGLRLSERTLTDLIEAIDEHEHTK